MNNYGGAAFWTRRRARDAEHPVRQDDHLAQGLRIPVGLCVLVAQDIIRHGGEDERIVDHSECSRTSVIAAP
jgi:hypothetical protein